LASGVHKYRTESFSLAGSAIWGKGVRTHRRILSSGTTEGLYDFESHREAITNITEKRHGNAFAEAYSNILRETIQSTEEFAGLFRRATLHTESTYETSSRLEQQLKQVAKLMQMRRARKVERDFFIVSIGGWDMHSNLMTGLNNGFNVLDRALKNFITELRLQRVWDSTAIITESDFGRTLTSNGAGSDHAWAGNYLLLSGALLRSDMINEFPMHLTPALNDRVLNRGRLIPTYPYESMMVPIAEWLDVETEQRAEVFPNLAVFEASNSSQIRGRENVFKPDL